MVWTSGSGGCPNLRVGGGVRSSLKPGLVVTASEHEHDDVFIDLMHCTYFSSSSRRVRDLLFMPY